MGLNLIRRFTGLACALLIALPFTPRMACAALMQGKQWANGAASASLGFSVVSPTSPQFGAKCNDTTMSVTAAFTTSSTSMTLAGFAAGAIAGADVYDMNNFQHIGTIASVSGLTITLTAAAAHASSGSGDTLQLATDDQSALTAWLSYINTQLANGILTEGHISGKCAHSGQLFFPQFSGMTFQGEGSDAMFVYIGSSTTTTPYNFGTYTTTGVCSLTDLTIQNLSFSARTIMTAGDGVIMNDVCGLTWINVRVRDELDYHYGNWWNGIEFKGGNTAWVDGYQFLGRNVGELIEGCSTSTACQYSDMFQTKGQILGAARGVELAGNVGGFNIDQTDIVQNQIDMVISQDVVSIPNSQIFIGPLVDLDVTLTTSGTELFVTDAGGANSILTMAGTWVAGGQNVCIIWQPGVQWVWNWSGGTLANCANDMVLVQSASVTGKVDVMVWPNAAGYVPTAGYAFDCSVVNTNLDITMKLVGTPPTGIINTNCKSATYVAASSNTRTSQGPLASNQTGTSGWQYDTSGAPAITIATGGNASLPVGSGLVVLTQLSTGDVSIWACGGGVVTLLSSTRGYGTAAPPATGKYSLGYTGSAYAIYNNSGATDNFTTMQFRTRNAN